MLFPVLEPPAFPLSFFFNPIYTHLLHCGNYADVLRNPDSDLRPLHGPLCGHHLTPSSVRTSRCVQDTDGDHRWQLATVPLSLWAADLHYHIIVRTFINQLRLLSYDMYYMCTYSSNYCHYLLESFIDLVPGELGHLHRTSVVSFCFVCVVSNLNKISRMQLTLGFSFSRVLPLSKTGRPHLGLACNGEIDGGFDPHLTRPFCPFGYVTALSLLPALFCLVRVGVVCLFDRRLK